jgi:hypothetical protein
METTSDTIMNMIASVHQNKGMNADDIEEWCAQAIKNVGEAVYFTKYIDAKLPTKNGIAVLPCNLYRLQTVKPGNGSKGVIYFRRTGKVLRFDKHHVTNIYSVNPDPKSEGTDFVLIDYLGIPIGSNGRIVIEDPLSEACYWYCLSKLYEEDVITGKMNLGQFQIIQTNYGNYATKAKQSFVNRTNNDMDQINRVVYNQMLSIRTPNSLNS